MTSDLRVLPGPWKKTTGDEWPTGGNVKGFLPTWVEGMDIFTQRLGFMVKYVGNPSIEQYGLLFSR